ncbi:MAG TPA: flagellar biosynthetic protein FliO [Polyangiaceae bacterium]
MTFATRKVVVLALGLVSLLTVLPAGADVLDKPDASADPPAWLSQRGKARAELGTHDDGPSGFRSLLLVVLVGGLGGGALYMKKRRQAPKAAPLPANLRVIASTRLTAKAQAIVAQVGGRTILLGVTDTSVRRLAWLDDNPALAAAPEAEHSDSAPAPSDMPLNFEGRPIRPLLRERAPVTRTAQAAERFSQVLSARLGEDDKPGVQRERNAPSPAETLAQLTEDVYRPSRSRSRKGSQRNKTTPLFNEPEDTRPASATVPSAYEGQIAGLSARLRGNVA